MLTDADAYTIKRKHLDYVLQWIVYSNLNRLNYIEDIYKYSIILRNHKDKSYSIKKRWSQLLESYNQCNQDFLWSGAKNKITKRGRHQ